MYIYLSHVLDGAQESALYNVLSTASSKEGVMQPIIGLFHLWQPPGAFNDSFTDLWLMVVNGGYNDVSFFDWLMKNNEWAVLIA